MHANNVSTESTEEYAGYINRAAHLGNRQKGLMKRLIRPGQATVWKLDETTGRCKLSSSLSRWSFDDLKGRKWTGQINGDKIQHHKILEWILNYEYWKKKNTHTMLCLLLHQMELTRQKYMVLLSTLQRHYFNHICDINKVTLQPTPKS